MNNIFKSCCLVLILAASTIANAETGNLLIQVSGLSHNRGQVIANLFREHSDVMNIKPRFSISPLLRLFNRLNLREKNQKLFVNVE